MAAAADSLMKEVSIPLTSIENGTAFYIATVSDGASACSVKKRYSQFEALYYALEAEQPSKISGIYFPPKAMKLLFSHVTPEFVEERRVLLAEWLKKCMAINDIAKSNAMTEFFESDRVDTVQEVRPEQVNEELPEDFEVTDVTIPSFRTMSDHILYQCDVINARKRRTFQKWTILKRYNQFYDMDCLVRADLALNANALAAMPPFPPQYAKLLHDHMDSAFAEGRRAVLENYMKKMLRVPDVARNKHWLDFVGVQ